LGDQKAIGIVLYYYNGTCNQGSKASHFSVLIQFIQDIIWLPVVC